MSTSSEHVYCLSTSLRIILRDLAHHMKRFRLKHGFFTTYDATVFVRRVEDYKFEVSPPKSNGTVGA